MALDLRADPAVLTTALIDIHSESRARAAISPTPSRPPCASRPTGSRWSATATACWVGPTFGRGAPRPPCRTPRHRAHRRQRAAPLGERSGGDIIHGCGSVDMKSTPSLSALCTWGRRCWPDRPDAGLLRLRGRSLPVQRSRRHRARDAARRPTSPSWAKPTGGPLSKPVYPGTLRVR